MSTAQQVKKVFDDSYAQISAILTPDQRLKLDQIQKERREMMQAHWHGGGPGDPGGPRHDHGDHDGPPPAGPGPSGA